MATEEGWGGRLLPSPLSPSPRVFPSPSAGDTAPRPAWAGSGIHAWAGVGEVPMELPVAPQGLESPSGFSRPPVNLTHFVLSPPGSLP